MLTTPRASARILKILTEIQALDRQQARHEAKRVKLQARLDKYTCKLQGGHPVGEAIPGIVRRQYDGGPIDYDLPGGGW